MKKLLIFTVIALIGFVPVNAQDINFGAKAGVNFASITGDDTDGLSSRTSIHAGLVAEIVISEKFSFQPELLYSSQGADYKESEGYDGSYQLDYLNIPLMAKFYVGDGFSLEAGPQVGFCMSANEDFTFSSVGQKSVAQKSVAEKEDISEFVKDFDFGINVGVGYKMESGLNFGARYSLGLANIWDGEESNDFTNHNSVMQVFLGFFF